MTVNLPPDDLIDDLLKSTKKLINMMKENKMEERENTIQVEFTTETAYPEESIISGALGTLHDRFGWECRGKFVVTIEFYPDSEVEGE